MNHLADVQNIKSTCNIEQNSLTTLRNGIKASKSKHLETIIIKKLSIPLKNWTEDEIQIVTQQKECPKETIELRRSERHSIKSTTKTPPQSIPIPASRKQLRPITPLQTANILWKKLVDTKIEVKIGMVVLAKMSTFWPWPARILSFNKKKARVRFFGDLKEGSVNISVCVPFYLCDSLIFIP